MARTAIEWTECTWNPVTGCTKVSEGCRNCYAERMAARLKAMGQQRYRNGFRPTVHADTLPIPLRWKSPRMIFVNSMGDLFHECVPVEFIRKVFDTMRLTPRHTYQALTKRSKRLRLLSASLEWPNNLWMGVTVENRACVQRIDDLRECGAAVKFVSFEPLLGPVVPLDLACIDWAIVGEESGPSARPVSAEWIRELREECVLQTVRFFFKQWGGQRRRKGGRLLDGRAWDEYPSARTLVPVQSVSI